jgi:hypothetical protein
MGNQQTVPLISCQVEKDFGNAGEVVRGLVRLQVDGDQPQKHFEGIRVTLAGMEYDLSIGPDGKLHRSNGTRVKLTQRICDFDNGSLTPGVHEFRFELELPDEIAPPPTLGALSLSDSEHSDNASTESSMMSYATTSDEDDLSSEPFREVAYKIRASLKRKPGVPLNSDTHVWCQAVLCQPNH